MLLCLIMCKYSDLYDSPLDLIYTERQKKLIASSGRHSLKSTLSKLIIFGHKWALILLNKNIWKTQDFLAWKRRKMRLNHEKVIFRKSQKLLTERALSELHGGGLFRTFNSYNSFNFNGGLRKRRIRAIVCVELPAREASIFCDFLFHRIYMYLLFDWSKLLFFEMCLSRINLPNLCPNMNHFDAVDFSECHSEEVISFFWRSVYKNLKKNNERIRYSFKSGDCMGQIILSSEHFGWPAASTHCVIFISACPQLSNLPTGQFAPVLRQRGKKQITPLPIKTKIIPTGQCELTLGQ